MNFPDYENCELCEDLYTLRTQIVWGTGNAKTDLLFVAEGPGKDEDSVGRPFVGEAGRFLDRFFDKAGIDRAEIYLTNTVMCRPTRPSADGGLANRPPTSVEIANCLPRLRREIIAIDPILIVALGDIATKALVGKKLGITKARGTVMDIQLKTDNDVILTYAMLPVLHPAHMLRTRSQEQMAMTVNDLLYAKRIVGRYKSNVNPETP